MKLRNYTLTELSAQFITFPEDFKPIYLLVYEIFKYLENDFLFIELARCLAINTCITKEKAKNTDMIFINNYVLACFLKKELINNGLDDTVTCIEMPYQKYEDMVRLRTIFYEVIDFLSRALRSRNKGSKDNVNYYTIHKKLQNKLTKAQCRKLFNYPNYTAQLYCQHMNIHKRTYDKAQKDKKEVKKSNA